MNSLDIVILVLTFLSVLYSFFRGFVREVFSILSLILGFLFAIKFYYVPANYLSHLVNSLATRNLTGFVLILVGVILVITLIGSLIRRVLIIFKLGVFDRLLGILIGLLRGIFIGIIIIFLLIFFLPNNHPLLIKSRLSLYLVVLGEIPLKVVPDKIKSKIEGKKETLLDYWKGDTITISEGVGSKPEVVPQEGKK